MEEVDLGLGDGALVVMGAYLAVLLFLGWLGRVRKKEDSLRDFYLGGSTLGFVVLFLTLFATQYSGNTLLGFAGRSYIQGATYIVSVPAMILVITLFTIYAPRLFRLSRRFGYITPADFVYHRFGSDALRIATVILLSWGLANYILEQLVAMGHAMETISGGRIDFMSGVLILALVMLIYESLGGMRSVAWSDVIQGLLLFGGAMCILALLLTTGGGISAATQSIMEAAPAKLETPGAEGLRQWISYLLLLGIGVSIYPHLVQRLFAARSLKTLRGTLAGMAFMPLLTTLFAFVIGYIAIGRFTGLGTMQSDRVTLYILGDLIGQGAFVYWVVVLVLSALVAAIMSTADSALLSMGSMVTKDIYQVYVRPGASPEHYVKVGKLFGWGVMVLLVLGAWLSLQTESSIWVLIELKLEFMIQLAPVLLLGVFWKGLQKEPVLAGLVSGSALTLAIWCGAAAGLWDTRSPAGISAGLWGLAANFGICVAGGLLAAAVRPAERSLAGSPLGED